MMSENGASKLTDDVNTKKQLFTFAILLLRPETTGFWDTWEAATSEKF